MSFASSLESLAGYDPSTSAANSGASWQVNNVQELTLVAVRYYAGGVLLSADTTARPIVSNGAMATQASAFAPDRGWWPSRLAWSRPAGAMPAALGSRRGKGARVVIG